MKFSIPLLLSISLMLNPFANASTPEKVFVSQAVDAVAAMPPGISYNEASQKILEIAAQNGLGSDRTQILNALVKTGAISSTVLRQGKKLAEKIRSGKLASSTLTLGDVQNQSLDGVNVAWLMVTGGDGSGTLLIGVAIAVVGSLVAACAAAVSTAPKTDVENSVPVKLDPGNPNSSCK